MDDFQQDVDACLNVLRRGGLILYPTDTVWGIGCDATDAAAVEKIFVLKRRPSHKSLIVLLADERDLLQYVPNPDLRIFDYLQTAEKPTTVVYDAAVGLADNVLHEDGSAAIRIVEDKFCRHLIKRFRKAIVSTSANVSGEPAPLSFAAISPEIRNGVDYIVQYRQNDDRPATPSAVVKWNKDGSVTVLRP